MFKITAEQGKARCGILKTKTGSYETPFFMPVATKTAVKQLNSRDLDEIGVKTVISNSLILYLRPGLGLIKKFKGIHNFMNFKGCIFTDSGGFQILSDSFLLSYNEKGVHFKSPFDGTKHFLKPEDVIKIEETIGADVIMALDMVPRHGSSKKHIAECVELTAKWAERCKNAQNKKHKQLLFGITQGGTHKDLRKRSAKQIAKLNFDGIAFGGLCIGEERKHMYQMIDVSKKEIPKEKPIYLMGTGTPHDIVEAVAHGVDIFDSRLPARNARHGNLFTKKGSINLLSRKHSDKLGPIEKGCKCFTCRNYSKAYVAYMIKQKEATGLRLATVHNQYFVLKLTEQIRKEIKKGTFNRFKKDFMKNYKFKEQRGHFSYC